MSSNGEHRHRLLTWVPLALGGLVLATAFGLWGHYWRLTADAEVGFSLAELLPCLATRAFACTLPLCADWQLTLVRQVPLLFWSGLSLITLGTALRVWRR